MRRIKRAWRNVKLLGEVIVWVLTGGASGCAGRVVDPPACPDHAIPTMTCEEPLAPECFASPNVFASADGTRCVVDIETSCTPEQRYHVLTELGYQDDGSWTGVVKLWASQCRLEAR